MGYDVNRFCGKVDDELICHICHGVLEDPVQGALCEHAFCRGCITEWLSRQETCPVDKNTLTIANLSAVPRVLHNFLSRLSIKCDNAAHGCELVSNLESLNAHLEKCEYNPKRLLPCEKGCGSTIPKDEMANHNCIRELHSMIDAQQKIIDAQQKSIDTQQKTNAKILESITKIQQKCPILDESVIICRLYRDDVLRWSRKLPRWEFPRLFTINTPNRNIETVIRRVLSDSGCPTLLLDKLMENCQGRRWPRGFFKPHASHRNHQVYSKCVWRRIPNTKVVLILSCENTHISDEALLIEPGLIVQYFD